FDGQLRRGFNTDVAGITRSLAEAGVREVRSAMILGGGATAASALVAAQQLGATDVALHLRSPEKAGELVGLAQRIGAEIEVLPLAEVAFNRPDLVISTLPNSAGVRL